LIAWLLRLPRRSDGAATRLLVTRDGEGERWCRRFGDYQLETRQFATSDGWLGERFGPLEFTFALVITNGCLVFRQRAVAIVLGRLRVRLPRQVAPLIDAREWAEDARAMRIDVEVRLPVAGRLVRYDGVIHLEGPRG
jgi:hypothetical protein